MSSVKRSVVIQLVALEPSPAEVPALAKARHAARVRRFLLRRELALARLFHRHDPGFQRHPVPIVDPMEYPSDVRKHLRIQADEADAYHAARCGHRFWMFVRGELTEEDLTPSEWDLFAETHTYTRGAKKGLTEKNGIIFKEGKRFFRFATAP